MIIKFETKWGDAYYESETAEAIMVKVLTERISDGFWYDEQETVQAKHALEIGNATRFMNSRRDYEYERFAIVSVEKV